MKQSFKQTGLPDFERGETGFPLPGPVVRYYREKMTYTDKDGTIRYWTQIDLARCLQLSERSVRLMETENKHLGSIERRWTLATLLKIPPALLGLASFDELQRILQQHPTEEIVMTSAKSTVNPDEIPFYQDALHAFKNAYDQGELPPQTMEAWIKRLNEIVEPAHGKTKNDTLTILAKYHMLAADIYSNDLRNSTVATNHLNTAKHIANIVNDSELLAIACYHAGVMYGSQQNYLSARNELDLALSLSKSASPQVKGNILTFVTQAHALTCVDEADRVYIRQLLDEAERYITENFDSNSLMKFDIVQYLENRADTLISLKRYHTALECINEAEEYLITKRRNIEYLKILRAECYVKQKKAEYERATELLTQILENNKNIQYYVNYVSRLYKLIATSPYGNAPDVADLEMMLKKLQTKPRP